MQISFKSPFKGKVLLNARLEVLCVPGLMSCLPSALVSLPNVTDTNAPLPISIPTTMAAEYYKINGVSNTINAIDENIGLGFICVVGMVLGFNFWTKWS